jgi:hypothetical protein
MRSLIRIVAPLLAVAAIALGGASSALAASPVTYSLPIDEAWCFDDGARDYCFEVTGHAQFVTTGSKESVVATTRFHTTFYEQDAYVGESVVTSLDRFVLAADGSYTQQTVWHTKSALGDEVCSMQVVWMAAEFETVVDHWSGGCTSA